MERKTAVCLEDVTKWYGEGQLVLDRINLKIYEKEKLLIIGNAGSGKTTLAHILCGFQKADDGKVIFSRRPGLMLTKPVWFYEMNVLDNVCLPLLCQNASWKSVALRAEKMLEYFGLREKSGSNIKYLSVLEKKYVQLVQAMISKPEVLAADQWEIGVDEKIKTELYVRLFEAVKQFQLGLVCFSDRYIEAEKFDRVLQIKNGRLEEALSR